MQQYKDERRKTLYGLLGDLPPLSYEISAKQVSIEEKEHYILEKLLLDLNGIEPVPAYFVKPKKIDGRIPAILYNHAHGGNYEMGKEELISSRGALQKPAYAEVLAQMGYCALCIDTWAFGERRGRTETEIFKEMLWTGKVMWGMMVYDSIRAIDYLATTARPPKAPERCLQRDGQLQRDGRARDPRVHDQQDGRVRLAQLLQPLLGRVGLGDGHAVPVDQAGGLALGRHPQRHDRALAQRDRRAGGLRSQFTHVIDVAPTILEAAGLPEPTMVNGVQQRPMEGTSMLYRFEDAEAPERHDLQYFEMFGNRGIYHRGWSAVTKHRTPWVMVGGAVPAFDDDVWELYDGRSDYSQAHDLVAEQPEMLATLQRLWLIEATKYNVLPMDDRRAERIEPSLAGRPTLIHGNRSCSSRHGASLGEQCGQHQEQVVLGDRRDRGPATGPRV